MNDFFFEQSGVEKVMKTKQHTIGKKEVKVSVYSGQKPSPHTESKKEASTSLNTSASQKSTPNSSRGKDSLSSLLM